MMNVDAVSAFLSEQLGETPEELQPLVMEFETLWERKLWHQLTGLLITFFDHPDSAAQRLRIYNQFIAKFADKINQLKLVDLALKAATQCATNREGLAFMEAVARKVDHEDSQDALVFATIAVARVRLDLDDLDGARKDLDRAERVLDAADSVETVVHAAFYSANADYFQAKDDLGSYYRNALLYLACIDLKSLPPPEARRRARDLAVAALASTTIYNFGELLLHPILDTLAQGDAQDQWLREMLFAFNRGDLTAYDALMADRRAKDASAAIHPIVTRHARQLRDKIYLAALTESVFRRPPHDRNLGFAAIQAETRVAPDDIEHLVMKALALGLIRGTIDQVNQLVHVDWVQPKVLDMKQIDNMRLRLHDWEASVNQLGNWIETIGQDVWAV